MEYYTWILTFHIVAFMSWMTMLFYLPRLFVYHVENIEKKDFVEVVNDSGANNGSFDVVGEQNSGNERSTILTVSGGGLIKQ